MGVLADQVVGLAAQVHKVVEAAGGFVPTVDDIRHVRGEDKGRPVPVPGDRRDRVSRDGGGTKRERGGHSQDMERERSLISRRRVGGHPPPGQGQGASPVCRDEGRRSQGPLSPLDVAEHLGVAQEPAKIDVEHVARGLEHDVVVVPVTDAQHVGGHAAAGAGVDEIFHSL